MNVNLPVMVYTTKQELEAVKKGQTVVRANITKNNTFSIPLLVNAHACEFLEGNDVLINLAVIKKKNDELSEEMGKVMGNEMHKALMGAIAELE